jgi:hypothetical protein
MTYISNFETLDNKLDVFIRFFYSQSIKMHCHVKLGDQRTGPLLSVYNLYFREEFIQITSRNI